MFTQSSIKKLIWNVDGSYNKTWKQKVGGSYCMISGSYNRCDIRSVSYPAPTFSVTWRIAALLFSLYIALTHNFHNHWMFSSTSATVFMVFPININAAVTLVTVAVQTQHDERSLKFLLSRSNSLRSFPIAILSSSTALPAGRPRPITRTLFFFKYTPQSMKDVNYIIVSCSAPVWKHLHLCFCSHLFSFSSLICHLAVCQRDVPGILFWPDVSGRIVVNIINTEYKKATQELGGNFKRWNMDTSHWRRFQSHLVKGEHFKLIMPFASFYDFYLLIHYLPIFANSDKGTSVTPDTLKVSLE